MNLTRFVSILALLATVLAGTASAQLTGTFTCANGNPGSAFDYGDIGAFFDAVEAQGLSGPVVLEVYDDGGAFTSTSAYGIGLNASGGMVGIIGISAINTVTVRAAPGEFPVIQGSGAIATSFNQSGTLLAQTNFVTFEGLECVGGVTSGISFYGNPLNHVNVIRCKVHGVTVGPGISLYSDIGGPLINCTIENNVVWNCAGTAAGFGSFTRGALAIRRADTTTVVRNNTVVHNAGLSGSAAFGYLGGSTGVNTFTFEGNIFVCSTSGLPVLDIASSFDPVGANYNVYHATGGATFHSNTATFPDFAAWQASSRDAQGTSADPQLVSMAVATFDYHLQQGSPAIDRVVGSTLNIDVDGDPRPFGAAVDAGADEISGPPPEMVVEYNAVAVPDGGSVDIGTVTTNGGPFTFVATNIGAGDLMLTGNPLVGVTPGLNCDATTVLQTPPANTLIPSFVLEPFEIFVDPTAPGTFELVIEISNNDSQRNPYNFTVTGMAVLPNLQASASTPGGSGFSGPVNGPFTMTVDPGATLTTASIELTDPESDDITLVSVTLLTPALAGVTAPSLGTPAHPRTLNWTGTVSPTNAPGPYEWEIVFSDAVNGTQVSATVSIAVNDLPPTHAIASATGGNGSPGTPYTAQFIHGDTAASSTDMCAITDPNASQLLTLVATTPGAGNPAGGAGFSVSFSGGLLSIAPAGPLVVADLGSHSFEAEISDGTHTINIALEVEVIGTAPAFTSAPIEAATPGSLYSYTVAANGTPAPTVTLTSALPGWLSFDTGTGLLSGIPTRSDQKTSVNVAFLATNGVAPDATQTFTITVGAAASTGTSGDSGCSAGGGFPVWPLLIVGAGLGVTLWLRRRVHT